MVCLQRRIRKKVSTETIHDRLPVLTQWCRYGGVCGEEEAQLHTPVRVQRCLLALYHIGRNDQVVRNYLSDLKNKVWRSFTERTANHVLVLLNGSLTLKAVKMGPR